MSDGERRQRQKVAETMNGIFGTLNRAASIKAGIGIPIMTVAGFFFLQQTAPGALERLFWHPLIIAPLAINAIALYWLFTAFKPEYAITNLIYHNSDLSRTQIQSWFMLAGLTIFWSILLIVDQPLLDRLFLFLITLPVAFFGYYGISKDRTNPIDRRFGFRPQDGEGGQTSG